MKFSEFDIAYLGLAAEADYTTSSIKTQNQHPPMNNVLFHRYPDYRDSISESPSNSVQYSEIIPNVTNPTTSNTDSLDHNIDPSLSYEPWSQAPQLNSLQIRPSQAGKSVNEAFNAWTEVARSSGTFQYSPVTENQQSGLPRRRSR